MLQARMKYLYHILWLRFDMTAILKAHSISILQVCELYPAFVYAAISAEVLLSLFVHRMLNKD